MFDNCILKTKPSNAESCEEQIKKFVHSNFALISAAFQLEIMALTVDGMILYSNEIYCQLQANKTKLTLY